MFECAQPIVAFTENRGVFGHHDARLSQRIECRPGAAQAQRRIAAAVDQLVRLRKELDLADAATPALEIIARPHRLPAGIVIADAGGEAADLGNRAEIEAAPPDERADRVEKGLPCYHVARCRAGADIGGTLPCERA